MSAIDKKSLNDREMKGQRDRQTDRQTARPREVQLKCFLLSIA